MRGKAASKTEPMPWWRVKATRDHGGQIYGRRREVGDTFQAPESAVTFDLLEELIEKIDPPAGAAATEE